VVCLGGPFYQDNSSESFSITNDEFGEHLTKDLQKVKRCKDFFGEILYGVHSSIQNLSTSFRFPDPC